ncbi:hypothetical protein VZ28_19020 [Salmonella enterica]|nr:hypothetical protein [Salmonella enterica]EBA3012883.1 hypothetical protein [Salmonella enterica]
MPVSVIRRSQIFRSARRVIFLFASSCLSMRRTESVAYFHERRSLNNFHRDRVITFEQIAE